MYKRQVYNNVRPNGEEVYVSIDGQQISNAVVIDNATYASAEELANALGYTYMYGFDCIILRSGNLVFESKLKYNGRFIINVRKLIKAKGLDNSQ